MIYDRASPVIFFIASRNVSHIFTLFFKHPSQLLNGIGLKIFTIIFPQGGRGAVTCYVDECVKKS